MRSLQTIRERVTPHFSRWPILSAKQTDVESFIAVCDRMAKREHLEPGGLIEIVRIVKRVNPSGKRRFNPDVIIDQLSEMKA